MYALVTAHAHLAHGTSPERNNQKPQVLEVCVTCLPIVLNEVNPLHLPSVYLIIYVLKFPTIMIAIAKSTKCCRVSLPFDLVTLVQTLILVYNKDSRKQLIQLYSSATLYVFHFLLFTGQGVVNPQYLPDQKSSNWVLQSICWGVFLHRVSE